MSFVLILTYLTVIFISVFNACATRVNKEIDGLAFISNLEKPKQYPKSSKRSCFKIELLALILDSFQGKIPYLKWTGDFTRIMAINSQKLKQSVREKINPLIIKTSSKIIKPFSKKGRRIFEHQRIGLILGVLVVLVALGLTFLSLSVIKVRTIVDQKITVIPTEDSEKATTKKSIRLPVDNFTITQGYSFFHPAIDLAATKGSPVYPIMPGTVEKIGREKFAFGNYAIVDHGSGFKTVYAHLAKIEVKEGEKIDKNSIVGLVGSTGWSTGPHLHLQIWEDNKWINPRIFFESYFGERIKNTR